MFKYDLTPVFVVSMVESKFKIFPLLISIGFHHKSAILCSLPEEPFVSVAPLIFAPVNEIAQSSLNSIIGPLYVISRPAVFLSLFPSNLFPARNAKSSIGPDGGTPTRQYPIRPGYDTIIVCKPPERKNARHGDRTICAALREMLIMVGDE